MVANAEGAQAHIPAGFLLTIGKMKDKIFAAVIVFQSSKILSHSLYSDDEPLNSQSYYSNWTSQMLLHVSLVPEATCPSQHT